MVSQAKEKQEQQESQAGAAVTKDMTIGEVVAKYPETAEIMMGYGLHCIGCHVNPYESIEGGAMGHGMSPQTIRQLVKDMNEAISGSSSDNDINLSDSAVQKFKDLMHKENKDGWGLKFSVEPGGCSGFSYVMDFAEKPEATELMVEEKGLKVFVGKEVLPMVKGVKIDYHDGLNGAGFKISNPNAQGSCGCGKSFH
ncbi:MAG: iron-sulfur cluster assembly accessory protein [archaeon]